MIIFLLLAAFCSCLYGGDLHKAIKLGKELEAQLLLKTKPEELNTFDHEGLAPIHLAVIYNQPDVAKKLLESKADFNLVTKHGETPIILAFKLKNYPILNMFQEMGVILEGKLFYKYLQGKFSKKKRKPEFRSISDKKHIFNNKIKNIKLHRSLVYTYGLFYTDSEFFQTLLILSKENTGYKTLISNILREFAFESFPAGLPLIHDLEKLNQLMSAVETGPYLRLKLWKSIEQIGQQAELVAYNRPFKIINLGDTNLKPEAIAEAITEISEYLLQGIKLNETIAWLLDDKKGASIQAAADFSSRLTNWLAFQIVSTPDEKIQHELVKKVAKVAQELFRLRNFWGVAQVISVLNRADIRRLKCCRHKKKVGLELSKFVELMSPENNYAAYRSTILEESKEKTIFPNIDVIFLDLKGIFEMRTEQFEDAWLLQMASMFKSLIDYKKQAKIINNKNKLLTAFFFNISMIPDEVIEAYSNTHNPWASFKDRASHWKEKKLDSWNCHDLYAYLESDNLLPCFITLLEAGLWDGAKITEHLYYHTKSSSERLNILIENGIPLDLVNRLEMNLFLAR